MLRKGVMKKAARDTKAFYEGCSTCLVSPKLIFFSLVMVINYDLDKRHFNIPVIIFLARYSGGEKLIFKGARKVSSHVGNRTRTSWVKARYPNHWTTRDYKLKKFVT